MDNLIIKEKEKITIAGCSGIYKTIKYPESPKLRSKQVSMWHSYKNLCSDCTELGFRKINLPEAITEAAFCLSTEAIRIIDGPEGTSFDCWNPKTDERIELKACANIKCPNSWSPKSTADIAYWLDFSRLDGSYDAYRLGYDLIESVKVNGKQKFTDQQTQGRRPRFVVKSALIDKYRLKPEFTGSIYTNKIESTVNKEKVV